MSEGSVAIRTDVCGRATELAAAAAARGGQIV